MKIRPTIIEFDMYTCWIWIFIEYNEMSLFFSWQNMWYVNAKSDIKVNKILWESEKTSSVKFLIIFLVNFKTSTFTWYPLFYSTPSLELPKKSIKSISKSTDFCSDQRNDLIDLSLVYRGRLFSNLRESSYFPAEGRLSERVRDNTRTSN